MTAENKKVGKRKDEVRLLVVAIIAPIMIGVIVAGVPVIWNGLVTVYKTIFPNIWVFVVDLYIALIAFLVGRITKR